MSISKTINVSNIYEFHSDDVNEDKHSRTSSFKERGNDEDIINELADKYMEHLERGKIKGTPSRSKSTVKPNRGYLYLRVTILWSNSTIAGVTLLCHLKPTELWLPAWASSRCEIASAIDASIALFLATSTWSDLML
ncbi:hypothetical protein Tco_0001720 [Tanacetum coccineum]